MMSILKWKHKLMNSEGKVSACLRIILCSLVVLCGGIFLGVSILAVSFLLPVNHQHFEESRAVIERESWYPMVPELSPGMYFQTFSPGVLDNSSDNIMLYTAMDDSEGSPLYRAMDMYSEYSGSYSYYWHGYVSILRPLSLLFNYSEIRVLNGMLQIFLIIMLFQMLCKRKGSKYGILLFSMYCLLMPVAVGFSLQYSWVFYIAVIGEMLLIWKEDYWHERCRYLYFFLVLGMLTSYLDLLTYPLFTWGFPLLMLIIISAKEKKAFVWLYQVVSTGIMWIIGYGGMWLAKWIIASRILHRDILQEAIDEIFLNVGAQHQVVWSSRWDAIANNWKHFEYIFYMLIIAGWLVWILYRGLQSGWNKNAKCYALALIAVSPIVWYCVLTRHTEIHHLFTYRIFCISILAVLGGGIVSFSQETSWCREKIVSGLKLWMGVLIAAVILFLFSWEEEYVFNGESSGRTIHLEDGKKLVSEFHPAYTDITGMQFYIFSDSTEGNYLIELCQDDEVIDQRSISMNMVRGQNSFSIDVDWKLDVDKQYHLAITAMHGNADSYIIAVNPGEELLPEYGHAFTIGDQLEDGQIVAGVNYRYWKLPEGKEMISHGVTCVLISILPVLVVANAVGDARTLYTVYKKNKQKVPR